MSTDDSPHSSRPKTAPSKEMVQNVYRIVLKDRRLKLAKIAEAVGTLKEPVHHILCEVLDMKK